VRGNDILPAIGCAATNRHGELAFVLEISADHLFCSSAHSVHKISAVIPKHTLNIAIVKLRVIHLRISAQKRIPDASKRLSLQTAYSARVGEVVEIPSAIRFVPDLNIKHRTHLIVNN